MCCGLWPRELLSQCEGTLHRITHGGPLLLLLKAGSQPDLQTMTSLPSPRQLVASLISSMRSSPSPTEAKTTAPTGNPLKDASPAVQKALLTLHVLFPNELLPALDLLERGLITRFMLASRPSHQRERATGTGPEAMGMPSRTPAAVYLVRSAQPQSRHRSASTHTTSYEVRFNSWNCSCPTFAFAAFPADSSAESLAVANVLGLDAPRGDGFTDWTFGGLTRGADMPVCKHLLACVLVEHCEMFRSFAEEREVSAEELAGWAAGWGD